MRYKNLALATLIASLFIACAQPTEAPAPAEPTKTASASEGSTPTFDTTMVIADINAKRTAIETNLKQYQKVEIGKEKLRAKTRQKWEKLHFYQENGTVVRIKSYPYATISKRTEEFYFDNGKLVLVLIEDNGEEDKPNESEDKLYYFHEGEAFSEVSKGDEREFSTLKAEGEELMEEAQEYLELLKNN